MATKRYHIEDTVIDKSGNKHILYPKNTISDVYLGSSTAYNIKNKIIYSGSATNVGTGSSANFVMTNTGLTSANLTEGTHISVYFENDVTAGASLNIDGIGNKNILIEGGSSEVNTIRGGDIVDLIYKNNAWNVKTSHPQGRRLSTDETTFSLSKIKTDKYGHVIGLSAVTQADLVNGLNMATKDDIASIDIGTSISDKMHYTARVSGILDKCSATSYQGQYAFETASSGNYLAFMVSTENSNFKFEDFSSSNYQFPENTHLTLEIPDNLIGEINSTGTVVLFHGSAANNTTFVPTGGSTSVKVISYEDASMDTGFQYKTDVNKKPYIDLIYKNGKWDILNTIRSSGLNKSTGLYKVSTNTYGNVIHTEPVEKSDITALGIPAQDSTYTLSTITGTLSVSKGGTGRTSLNSGQVLLGNGTGSVNFRQIDTTITNTTNLLTSSAVKSGLDLKANSDTAATKTELGKAETKISNLTINKLGQLQCFNGGSSEFKTIEAPSGLYAYTGYAWEPTVGLSGGGRTLYQLDLGSFSGNQNYDIGYCFFGTPWGVGDITKNLSVCIEIWDGSDRYSSFNSFRSYFFPDLLHDIVTFGYHNYLTHDNYGYEAHNYYTIALYDNLGNHAFDLSYGKFNNNDPSKAFVKLTQIDDKFCCLVYDNFIDRDGVNDSLPSEDDWKLSKV